MGRYGVVDGRGGAGGFRLEQADQRLDDDRLGHALDPRAEYDLGPIYRAIEEDLQSQYVLGYYPGEAARDGRYHQIEVKVISRDARKYRVQLLREGYQSGGH